MSILRKLAVRLTGNPLAQRLLEMTLLEAQLLMGIGSAKDVAASGEKAVLELVQRRARPPYCIFDVGANQGQYLRLVREQFRDDELRVHCFEPSAYTFRLLEREAAGEPAQRIRLNNIALGKEEGKLPLFRDEPGSGLASLTKRRLDHLGITFEESETVAVGTIDCYCSSNGVDHIDLLKLDVEGHELDVLAGASTMLARQAVDLIAFEFGGCNIDTRTFFQDFHYFFRECGMAIYRVTPAGFLCEVGSYREIHEQFRTTNFVAARTI